MKIIDASRMKTNPLLPGIPRAKILYMDSCFPAGSPVDEIDRDFTVQIGERAKKFGHDKIIFDIEDRAGDEPSQIYRWSDPEMRVQGIDALVEFIGYIREGYGEGGDFGFYRLHADWSDAIAYQESWPEGAEERWQKAASWESDMRKLAALCDTLYPSVYGHFQDWYDPDPAVQGAKTHSIYGEDYTLDMYRALQRNNYQYIDATIKFMHDKPYEWFITDNINGAQFPTLNLDWQLEQLRRFRKPVNVWSDPASAAKFHPEGKPEWTPTAIGILNGHSG